MNILQPITGRKIVLVQPGEEIVIRAAEPTMETRPPADAIDDDGRFVLRVPYRSQWGRGADRGRSDCGPACLAMIVPYLTDQEPTVDDVAVVCGMDPTDQFTSFNQLAKGARVYGLTPTYIRPLTRQRIETEIKARFPILALINYSKLPNNQDDYRDAHFVAIVGFDDDYVIFHDPDRLYGDDFGEFRTETWDTFLTALGTTHELASNDHSNHGMVFSA